LSFNSGASDTRRSRGGGLRPAEFGLAAVFGLPTLCALLYILRRCDDNTLVSWRWAFAATGIGPVMTAMALTAGTVVLWARVPPVARRRQPGLFLLALAVGAATWSEPEVMIDAGRYFMQAKFVSTNGVWFFLREWGRGISAWTDLPLVPLIHGMALRLGGEQRAAVLLVNTVLFAATAVLTARTAAMIGGRGCRTAAGLFFLSSPYLLTQVPLMLVDVAAMFFLTLALWSCFRAMLSDGWAMVPVAAVSLAAAWAAKYSLWPMSAVLLAAPAAAGMSRATARRSAAIVLAAALLLLPLAWARRDVLAGQLHLLFSYQGPALGRWREGPVSTFVFQIPPWIAALAAYGAVAAARQKRWEVVWLGLLFLGVAVFVQRIRYLLPLLPCLCLAAAWGMSRLADAGICRLAGWLGLAYGLVIYHGAYLPFLEGVSLDNLRRAGRYLNGLESTAVEVVALPQPHSGGSTFAAVMLLDLYTDKQVISRQHWPTRPVDTRHPLRFTWSLSKPRYYTGGRAADMPVVVISGRMPPDPGPAGMPLARRFIERRRVFRYKTLVGVYRPVR